MAARSRCRAAVLGAIAFVLVSNDGGAQVPAAAIPSMGTLAGVVRDTLGKPLNDAEVLIPDLKRSVKANTSGAFTLDSVAPGKYEVWVRELGYIVVQFPWEAKANNRIEVAITMRPLPHTLDAVTVYANEERNMKSKSVVHGMVIDTAGNPIEGADVSLVGSGRATVSGSDGSFIFRHAPLGPLSVRSRLLGYAPASSQFRLLEDDERRVVLRMHPLAQMLDEVNVNAQSGFGPMQRLAEHDLDQRMRWRQPIGKAVLWDATDIARVGAVPMDLAIRGLATGGDPRLGLKAFEAGGSSGSPKSFRPVPGDACILEDGIRAMKRPLKSFTMSDFELFEYYPPAGAMGPETEWTGTLAERFEHVPGCEKGPMGDHPAWFAVWRKGSR